MPNQPKIILPTPQTPPLGVVRSVSRDEPLPGSLISSQNVLPYEFCGGFRRISQRPATNQFCDTQTSDPIQGMCPIPIIIQPGGVILEPPAYVLSTFNLASSLITGSTISGPGPANISIEVKSTVTISAEIQLRGNSLSTWTGFSEGAANAFPQVLFYFYFDGNDLPPSLIMGAQFGLGGRQLTASSQSGSTIVIGGINYNNSTASSAFIGYAFNGSETSSTLDPGPPFNIAGAGALAFPLTTIPNSGYAPTFSVQFTAVISFLNAQTVLYKPYVNGQYLGQKYFQFYPSSSTGIDITTLYAVSNATSYSTALALGVT